VTVQPYLNDVVSMVRGDLLLVGGATTLLILAVCANIAGLLMAWVLDRRRELAVRHALGANRLRLVRQVLTETGMLVLVGAAAGVLLGAFLIPAIQAFAPDGIPRLEAATLDARVLGGTLVLALVVWLTSGLLPSVQGSRVDLLASLKDGARGSTPGRDWGRRLVIIAQVAIACALLSGAAIVIESYAHLLRGGSVKDPQNVLALHVRLPRPYAEEAGTLGRLLDADHEWSNEAWWEQEEGTPAYRVDAAALDFVRRVTEGMQGVAGVGGVAFANYPPMWTDWQGGVFPAVVGADEPTPMDEREPSGRKWVSPNFFGVLGLPLLRGRTFTDFDGPGAEPVVIVDQSVVRRYCPDGDDPLGRILLFSDGGDYWGDTRATIVGVVANTLHKDWEALAYPILYVPLAQRAQLWDSEVVGWALRTTFIVRTERDPAQIAAALREAIWAVDPELPLVSARTLADHRAELFAQPRSFLFLLSSFAAVTLLLAAAGTVGLLARRVQQRTHEIGVRCALGATSRSIALRVIRDGAAMAAVGIAAGAATSFAVARILASRVLGVEGSAPGLLVGVAALLLATAIAASWLPAWRASHVDPVEALRTE
jgi:cell division protein FtsX